MPQHQAQNFILDDAEMQTVFDAVQSVLGDMFDLSANPIQTIHMNTHPSAPGGSLSIQVDILR